MLLAVLTIVSNVIYIFLAAVFHPARGGRREVGSGGSRGRGIRRRPFNPVGGGPARREVQRRKQKPGFLDQLLCRIGDGFLRRSRQRSAQYLQESWGWEAVSSYKPLFALTILFSIVLFFVYSSIATTQARKVEKKISRKTGVFVTKMSILGMVDNFGAGMAGSLSLIGFFCVSVSN